MNATQSKPGDVVPSSALRCDICGVTFASVRALRTHMELAHEPAGPESEVRPAPEDERGTGGSERPPGDSAESSRPGPEPRDELPDDRRVRSDEPGRPSAPLRSSGEGWEARGQDGNEGEPEMPDRGEPERPRLRSGSRTAKTISGSE
jgi:hypothetical protein